MYKDFDGEQIQLVHFTPIENKETNEIQSLIDMFTSQYLQVAGPYNIWFIIIGILIGISIPFCFVNISCVAIPLIALIVLSIIAIVKINKCTHLKNQIRIAKSLLITAIHNDSVKHDEKLRLIEQERLLESKEMKQVEIKTTLQEGKLPYKPKK